MLHVARHGYLVMLLSLPLPQTHLLSKLPIPDSQVLTIDPALPVEDAAEDYARKLRQVGPRTGGKAIEDWKQWLLGDTDCCSEGSAMVGRLGLGPHISGTLVCRPEVLVH